MIELHKKIIEKIRNNLGISYYQLYWICFIKGVAICYIVMLLTN